MKKRITIKQLCSMIAFMLFYCAAPTQAQTVHIGLDNGNLMNAVVPGNDSGWEAGFSTLWRHEQLSLSMMGSDRDGIYEESGLINYPSAVFGKHSKISGKADDHGITIVGGRRPSYIVVSLPKGYRITGYTIVLVNDLIGANMGGRFNNLNSNNEPASSNGYGTMRFCEVKQWKTDGTNSGTHQRLLDEDEDGYNLDRVRQIEDGIDWQSGQIGSQVIEWAKDENGNINIKTNDPHGANTTPKEYTLHRTATKIGVDANNQPIYDMDNNLYFRLVKDYTFYGLTIKEFRIEFSAEGTFKADVVPDAIGPATSVVASPFKTSKIDIGKMGERTKTSNGQSYTHYAFDSEEITDLVAYNYLYQYDAVQDGAPADVATNKHIRPVKVDNQLLYALESDTYFIETPIEITNKSGNTAPIGYRIVGALFTPLWGTETQGQTIPGESHNYITYTPNTPGEQKTYYLNIIGTQARFSEIGTTTWEVDDDGYVHSGEQYLACSGNNNNRTLSIGNSNTQQRLRKDGNNHFYYRRGNSTLYLHGTSDSSTTPTVTNNQDNLAVLTIKTDASTEYPSFTPGPYKLKIWKRDGSGILKTIEIEDEDDDELGKIYDMGICNNDAIKFEIETTGENAADTQALIQVTLLLQSLDPYIDKMDIVCHDDRDVLQLTQSFTADDFSVSGGKFIFYVPYDYKDEMLTFTFSDLYSKYGDETYYGGGSGFGRYSFVTSEYFLNRVDGNGNLGLYQTGENGYNPDHPYNGYAVLDENNIETRRRLSKIETSTAGNIRFKFNNAEDLEEGGIQEEGAELEEYPFSVKIYKASTDPGDPLSATPHGPNENVKGDFGDVKLQASSASQHSGTYFVFTADETRWNIARTTNWQHRFYAFYRMEIDLQAKTFTPELTWNRIYDSSYYTKKNDEGEEIEAEDNMWGLTLDIAETEPVLDEEGHQVYENGVPVYKKVQGYLTYQEIIDNIMGREETKWQEGENLPEGVNVGDIKFEAIASRLDPTSKTAPASMKQILYIDGTPLYAMLNSSQYSVVKTLEDLKKELGDNALVFLPENTTSTLDNVAYEIADEEGSTTYFHAGKDIVLTDNQPFFSPYDIQVDAANYATYSRTIPLPPASDEQKNVTLMLPFTLNHTGGVHTNENGVPGEGLKFTVNTMEATNSLSREGINYGNAYFMPITTKTTEANKPYMIKIDKNDIDENAENIVFTVSQKGSSIVKTPELANVPKRMKVDEAVKEEEDYGEEVNICTGSLIAGDNTTGTYSIYNSDETLKYRKTYSFTNYASYSGNKYDRAVTEDVFYFGETNNKYVDLHTLSGKYRYLYVHPFRGVFFYTATEEGDATGAKFMKWLNICYGENPILPGETTAIKNMPKWADLMLRTGKRTIILTATKDQTVSIYGMNGVKTRQIEMNAGESQVVTVPSGVYVVNGTKIVVR